MNEVAASFAGPVAVGAGLATVAIVFLLGALARGAPPPRTPSGHEEHAPDVETADAGAARAAGRDAAWRWVGPVLGASVGLVAAGPIGAAAGAAGAVVLRHRRRVRQAAADRRRIEAGLPDAIELLVLCVHAGRSPAQAIGELAQRAPPAVRSGFVAVERQLHRGQGLAEALGELPAVLGPTARELAAVVATAEREGLPLAPMLDRLATDARTARRRQGDAAARRLPVQLAFPLVTCVLPSFVLLALAPAVLGALSTLRGDAP